MEAMINFDFYRGERIFVIGHTGFKGTRLCCILAKAGAVVTRYSLNALTQPNLFELAGLENKMASIIGDIRDIVALGTAFDVA